MTNISREFERKIRARLKEKSPLIQVLIGPRQVGKTTAIKQIFVDQGIYFSADSPIPLSTDEIETLWRQALDLENPLLVWIFSSVLIVD